MQDENGNWSASEPSEVLLKGRYEVASNNQPKPSIDGKQTDHSGLIYMPVPGKPILTGARVEVLNGDGRVIAKGSVLQYAEGSVLRRNARIWI